MTTLMEGVKMTVEVFTVEEAAEQLKVSAATVYKMVRDEEINSIRVSKRIMFRPQDLDGYINRGDAETDDGES